MKLKSLFNCLSLGLIVSLPVTAAEAPIPTDSVGAVGVFAAYQKFRVYSEVCSEVVPESRSAYEAVLDGLTIRTKRIGARLLESEQFKDMKSQPVPPSLISAMEEDLENTRIFHRSNAATSVADFARGCRHAHENFRDADDDHWETGIAGALTELRNTGKPPGAAEPRLYTPR